MGENFFRDRNISLIHEPNLFSGVSEKQTKVQDVFVLRADPFNDLSTNEARSLTYATEISIPNKKIASPCK